MAYTPINWQTGDTITAEKMNKMDNGWSVDSSQLFSESVTTEDTGEGYSVGELTYSTLISASVIKVTFDGTQYECAYGDGHYGALWSDSAGAYDFSVYPFGIDSYSTPIGISNEVITETDGTHTISLSVESLEVSDNFKSAVNATIDAPLLCEIGVTTGAQIMEASNANRLMYFVRDAKYYILLSSYNGDVTSGNFSTWYPTAAHDFQSVGVSNGVFALNV